MTGSMASVTGMLSSVRCTRMPPAVSYSLVCMCASSDRGTGRRGAQKRKPPRRGRLSWSLRLCAVARAGTGPPSGGRPPPRPLRAGPARHQAGILAEPGGPVKLTGERRRVRGYTDAMAIDHPWSEPPAPGATIEVAPGVAWLRMPLPFQLNHINLWLVEDGPGWAIVDTGVGLPEVRALWEQIFAGRLGGRSVTRVVVTHFHPDHMGNAAWLMERWGVDLWC